MPIVYFTFEFANNKRNRFTKEMLKQIIELPITIAGDSRLQISLLVYIENENIHLSQQKLELFFNLYYHMNYRFQNSGTRDEKIENIPTKQVDQVLDFRSSSYMVQPLDEIEKYLLEAIKDIKEDRIHDGFPKLVMWIDKYIAKDSSGFCDVRNSFIHPDLYASSRQALELKYPGELEFNGDDSIIRDSEKNMQFLHSKLPELLDEIKPEYENRYFQNECLLDKQIFP